MYDAKQNLMILFIILLLNDKLHFISRLVSKIHVQYNRDFQYKVSTFYRMLISTIHSRTKTPISRAGNWIFTFSKHVLGDNNLSNLTPFPSVVRSEQCQTSPTCLGQGVPRQPQRRPAAQPGGGGGGGRARGRDCRRY